MEKTKKRSCQQYREQRKTLQNSLNS